MTADRSRSKPSKKGPPRKRASRGKKTTSTRRRRSPNDTTERLHKYIANCGYCSRRRAELLIEKGLVQVNGETVQGTGLVIDPTSDVITIHGEKITPPAPVTIALNKPAGYLTSTHDTHDRLTVMDLLPKKLIDSGVLPAGRLDYETEGLLIFTNDGELQHRITHPSFSCVKEYRVKCNRPLTDNDQRRLERGIFIRELGKRTSPAVILNPKNHRDKTSTCHILIGEGMKRQVRRMFQALGAEVVHLERIAIGDYQLGSLSRGQWRRLKPDDIHLLTKKRAGWDERGKK